MTRKVYVRPKKQKKEVQKKEEPSDTHSQDDDASSGSGADIKEISNTKSTMPMESTNKTHNHVHNECIYDSSMLFEQILKLNNPNFAGNPNLSWGKIKLQLYTKSLDELRKKFSELNVTLRQVGVDDERSFMDERIVIGERLL